MNITCRFGTLKVLHINNNFHGYDLNRFFKASNCNLWPFSMCRSETFKKKRMIKDPLKIQRKYDSFRLSKIIIYNRLPLLTNNVCRYALFFAFSSTGTVLHLQLFSSTWWLFYIYISFIISANSILPIATKSHYKLRRTPHQQQFAPTS